MPLSLFSLFFSLSLGLRVCTRVFTYSFSFITSYLFFDPRNVGRVFYCVFFSFFFFEMAYYSYRCMQNVMILQKLFYLILMDGWMDGWIDCPLLSCFRLGQLLVNLDIQRVVDRF
jgi:hypothetical protein